MGELAADTNGTGSVLPRSEQEGDQHSTGQLGSSVSAMSVAPTIPATPARVLMDIAREALSLAAAVTGAENEMGSAFAQKNNSDSILPAALAKALGAAANLGPMFDSYQTGHTVAALPAAIEALTRCTSRYPSLPAIIRILSIVHQDLVSYNTENLPHLHNQLSDARREAEKDLSRISQNLQASTQPSPLSEAALWKVNFGTKEARTVHFDQIKAMHARLNKAIAAAPRSEIIYQRYAFVVDELSNLLARSTGDSPTPYISGLNELLTCAVGLRQTGFNDPALDEIIKESLRACVAAETGQATSIVPAKWGTLGLLNLFSRRRSKRALAAVFGDGFNETLTGKFIAEWYQVRVLTREETCTTGLKALRERALKEIATEYLTAGKAGADIYLSTLARNPWVEEGRKHNLDFSVLERELLETLKPLCKQRVDILRDETIYQYQQTFRTNGRIPADAYLNETLRKLQPWIEEANRLNIPTLNGLSLEAKTHIIKGSTIFFNGSMAFRTIIAVDGKLFEVVLADVTSFKIARELAFKTGWQIGTPRENSALLSSVERKRVMEYLNTHDHEASSQYLRGVMDTEGMLEGQSHQRRTSFADLKYKKIVGQPKWLFFRPHEYEI